MNNKILVFESKNLGYDSSNCFLKVICEELRIHGFEVEYCRIKSLEDEGQKLVSYIGKSYLAVIDMNSTLSLAFHDGMGDYYLNLINAPFYHFIVDHPIHLHEKLSVPLKDYHVICLDGYHADYIRENYPNIKDVVVMPYGGMMSKKRMNKLRTDIARIDKAKIDKSSMDRTTIDSERIDEARIDRTAKGESEYEFKADFEERCLNIVFPATYMPEDYYLDLLKEKKPMYVRILSDMLDLLEASTEMGIEEAFKLTIADLGKSYEEKYDNSVLNINEISLLDRYIRAYLRNKAITELLKSKVGVHVIGANWGLYDGKDKKYLIIHEQVTYDVITELMADTKILFNTQPLFMDGPHDRVMNAVINGAAALTDECDYLNKHFNDGVDIAFYHRNEMGNLPQIVENIFANPDRLSDIAWKGYQKALNEHTWHKRIEELVNRINH